MDEGAENAESDDDEVGRGSKRGRSGGVEGLRLIRCGHAVEIVYGVVKTPWRLSSGPPIAVVHILAGKDEGGGHAARGNDGASGGGHILALVLRVCS